MEDEEFKQRLFALAEAYAASPETDPRKTPAGALRTASGGQLRLYDNLKDGGTTTFKMYDRCVQWFSDNWPENADWPEHIRRPKPTSKETADGE